MKAKKYLISISLLFFTFVSGQTLASPKVKQSTVRLATTTSTENSGLLNYILPKFEHSTGYHVQVIAVGTGKALRMGKDGDVDVLLVHALDSEKAFVKNEFGLKRHSVMYNDFVLLGPANDPAGIKDKKTLQDAFISISQHLSLFISRGDDSGTHKKEMKLWSEADIKPQGQWYREIGQGMGKAIQMADELGAYTIADRGTWLSYKSKLSYNNKTDLQVLYQGSDSLFNPYGLIAINPMRYSDINLIGANALIKWMTSKTGQTLIGQYKIDQQVLFTPSANL